MRSVDVTLCSLV